MSKINFSLEIKNRFSKKEWQWVLMALRQDEGIWTALEDSEFSVKALNHLPPEIQAWTPAALSLLALDSPVELQTLRASPILPLEECLLQRASKVYEGWLTDPSAPLDLGEAGLLALIFREQFRVSGSWLQNILSGGIDISGSRTALCCLYGMIPDPLGLLLALGQAKDPETAETVIHIYLSNPNPPEVQLSFLHELFLQLEPSAIPVLLQALDSARPNLAALLAKKTLSKLEVSASKRLPKSLEQEGSNQLEQLIHTLRKAHVHQIAGQADLAVPILSDSLRVVRKLRAQLSAQLAGTVAQAKELSIEGSGNTAQDASIEAWKQAVMLMPDDPHYAAGYVRALHKAGRTDEALDFLQEHISKESGTPGAELLLAYSLLLKESGDEAQAIQFLLQSLELFLEGQHLSEADLVLLVILLAKTEYLDSAMQAVQKGLTLFPASRELLALSAKLSLATGCPEKTIAYAYAVQSAESYLEFSEKEVPGFGFQSEWISQYLSDIPDNRELGRLLIESLEATESWDAAYQERLNLLEGSEAPSSDELWALARCASGAKKHDQVIRICQELLQKTPDRFEFHESLADSAYAVGDYDTAIQHFNRSVQLAPGLGRLWKGLFRSQKAAGLDSASFDTLRTASQALPNDASIQCELGELYLVQGAPTLALPCLRRAYQTADLEHEKTHAAIRLGEALTQLGRRDEARQILVPLYEDLQKSTKLKSKDGSETAMRFQLESRLAHDYARTLMTLEEPEKAVSILSSLVQEKPFDGRTCLDLSKALMMLGDSVNGAKRALPFIQACLDHNSDLKSENQGGGLGEDDELRAEARILLAEAYAAAGDLEKGLDAYRKALEEPANQETGRQARLSLGLGLTALKLELPEMAVAALQEAAQSEPLNGQIQRSLCEAYLSNGLAQDAFAAARAALELSPNDLDAMTLFIDQAMRIASCEGSAKSTVQAETIQVLISALKQAPERADLMSKLGNSLIEAGKQAEALEIFRKMAAPGISLQKISVDEIRQIVVSVLNGGDAHLAILLLEKGIEELQKDDSSENLQRNKIDLADLYVLQIQAFSELGEWERALEAQDKALNLDRSRQTFYLVKSELLQKLGRNKEARVELEEAIQRWPDLLELRYRLACVLHSLGDLPQALQQIEFGIGMMDESTDDPLHRKIFLKAAKLASASLRPKRAFAYLEKSIRSSDPDYALYENVILRAELALDAGEEDAVEHAINLLDGESLQTARSLAVMGRLAYRRNQPEPAERHCRSAVNEWVKFQRNQPGQVPAKNVEDFIMELSSIGSAALENRQWEEALSIFRQMVQIFPDEPLSHFMLAETLMKCAEAEALCRDFEVVKHSPGLQSLSDSARKQFEDSLSLAAEKLGFSKIFDPGGSLESWDVEIKRSIGLCAWRGQVVFAPNIENASALEYLLQTLIPEAEDIASLMMAYRRCGAVDRALKAIQVGWHPVFDGKDYRSDLRVKIQLILAEEDPLKAQEALSALLENYSEQGFGWPALPMLQFLAARQSFQASLYAPAQEAILRAVQEWPDEPRWQAFAAKIHALRPAENRLQQLADVIGFLEKAARLEPEYPGHLIDLGQFYLESSQVIPAVQTLQTAVDLDPENSIGWLLLAKAQNLAGDLEQAAISAEKAIEQAEEPTEALLLRAEIALLSENYRSALSRAQTVLRVKPDNAQALYILSRALEGLNKPAEALLALEQALPRFDFPIAMQLERLQLIKRSKGLDAGLKALQELVAQNPKQAAFLALLADWLKEAGKQDAAVQAARLALQEGLEGLTLKQRADLHTMIGLQMRKNGQLDQAIHHLSEAILQSSDFLDAYLELGRVYHERREYQQALKIYQKAINLAGDDYRPYYQAGLVLKDNKDYMAAEAMLQRAAKLAPNELIVHRLLGAVVALNLVHGHRLTPGDARRD